MVKKEEILESKEFKKLEIELDLTKTLGMIFKFPLNVLDQKSILGLEESILKIEKIQDDTERGSEFINQVRFLIMQDCIAYYRDKTSKQARFIQEKFIDKYYDPLDPGKSVNYFKNLCWFTADELSNINDYYYSYLSERSKAIRSIEEDQQNEMKELEKAKLEKEEKNESMEKLEKKYTDLILETENSLKQKYGL